MIEHERGPEARVNSGEIESAAAERLRSLEREPTEQHHEREKSVEDALEKIKHIEQAKPSQEASHKKEPVHHRPVLTREANYRQTMVSLRHRMKPAAKQFSKIIHTPAVETSSEIIGKTVLRPSVSLGATTTAVLVAGFIYLFARHYGFRMQGSEIWVALLVGGVFGLLIEGIYKTTRRMRGHRQ